MAFQIRSGETREFISPHDPDPANPTVWVIGTLDLRTRAFIQDEMTAFQVSETSQLKDKADVKLKLSQGRILTARFGIKGWRNLMDEFGQEIAYAADALNLDGKSYEAVSKVLIERFPFELVEQLAEAITNLNNVSERDRKN
jgi:hypothetical protein